MATSEALIDRLNSLLMLDHDAVGAYQAAIDRIKSPICKGRLLDFLVDHRRHIAALRECLVRYEGPIKDRAGVKGVLLKGITALQSMAGDEMALMAMQTNEKLTNKEYADALRDKTVPEDVREVIERNYADEVRHLAWIVEAIANRTWEEDRPTVRP